MAAVRLIVWINVCIYSNKLSFFYRFYFYSSPFMLVSIQVFVAAWFHVAASNDSSGITSLQLWRSEKKRKKTFYLKWLFPCDHHLQTIIIDFSKQNQKKLILFYTMAWESQRAVRYSSHFFLGMTSLEWLLFSQVHLILGTTTFRPQLSPCATV